MVGVGVTPLANGNYVVRSPNWNVQRGAVTWGSGAGGTTGPVDAMNSRVGTNTGDQLGRWVTALTNGNYVASSPYWNNPVTNDPDVGVATWGNGLGGTVGKASPGNSLIGASPRDRIGTSGAVALAGGNYVVLGPEWDNGAAVDAGAATWGDGAVGTTGVVTASNSIVGGVAYMLVGLEVLPLVNGNYVVDSIWPGGGPESVTWGNGAAGTSGVASAENSLVGSDEASLERSVVHGLADGNYVVMPHQDPLSLWPVEPGPVVLADGSVGLSGYVSQGNSVPNARTAAYDVARHRLIVGRPDENIVTVVGLVHGQMILNIVTRLEQ
jgi:hypothetical protein